MKLLPLTLSGTSVGTSVAALCGIFCSSSFAAAAAATTTATTVATAVNAAPGNLVQIIVSLVLVIGFLIVLSVAFKKFGLNRMHAGFPVKIIGAISIGNNQRLMIIEAGEEWLVLGVTPQHISTLGSMPRQETNNNNPGGNMDKPNFPAWMQSALEKYNGKKS